MGRLRNLAQTFQDFVMNRVEELDVPAVADGEDGYDTSTKIALLLLKEEINKPLRQLEDYLNEMPGILDVFDLEESPESNVPGVSIDLDQDLADLAGAGDGGVSADD